MPKQTWIIEVLNLALVFYLRNLSFDIQFSLIEYDGSHSYARAYLVGLLNTILVSVVGIFFATILGVIVGISRLSSNYLISKLAEVYVEVFRNIPLLLQIFFWYFAALRALPLPKDAINFFDLSFLTIKGFFIPRLIWTNFPILFYSFVAAIVSIVFIYIYAKETRSKQAKNTYIFYFSRVVNNITYDCIFFRWSWFKFGGSLSCTAVKNNF